MRYSRRRARQRRRRAAATGVAIVAACVLAIALTTGRSDAAGPVDGVLGRSSPRAHLPSERRTVAHPEAPTTTTTATPTAPLPPPVAAAPAEDLTLLSPADVPGPGVTLPVAIIGRIQIPKIGLDAELRDQITQQSIDLGPSHWPGTAAPGGFGNAVIGGHRSRYSAPFRDTGNLRPGDTVTLAGTGGRQFTYTVTDTFVVDPSAMWITEQTPGHKLTLFTCHPFGFSTQRLVIRATLTGTSPLVPPRRGL